MDSTLRSFFRIALGLAFLCYAVYVVGISLFPFKPEQEKILSALLFIGFALVFSLGNYRLSQLETRLRGKRALKVLALAGLCNVIGETIWFYNETFLHAEPFVTVGDIFYGLFYLLLLAGVLLLPYIPLRREARAVLLLDLAIVLTTSLMLFWYFVLFPLSLSPGEDLRVMLATFYPVFGLLVVAALIALLETTVEGISSAALLLLMTGMLFNVAGDTLFAYWEVNRISYNAAHVNLLYLTASILLLVAVAKQYTYLASKQNLSEVVRLYEKSRFLRSALPYVSTVIVFVLLAYVLSSAAPRVVGVLLGILCLLGLIFFRQYLVLRENIRLYKEMQRIAVTDELTGVSTRRFVKDALNIEFIRSQRYGRSLSILLLDLDHFKKYNDSYGHLKGDEALNQIAKVIALQLRATDMVGRFGGDEFLAVLPETDREGAELVAAKIKNAVDATSVSKMPIGITIGVATFHSAKSVEELLEEADRDLYRQKHSRVLRVT